MLEDTVLTEKYHFSTVCFNSVKTSMNQLW